MSTSAGVGLGLVAGGGAYLALLGTPWARRPTLDDRLAPYLRDTPRQSRLLQQRRALTPFPVVERLLGPVLGDAVGFVERWVGGLTSVRKRLETLGDGMTVEQFRAEQVVWGALGFAAALALAVFSAFGDGGPGPVQLLGRRPGPHPRWRARPRPLAQPAGRPARGADARGVPHDRRAAGARRQRGGGPGRRARAGPPHLGRRAEQGARPGAVGGPGGCHARAGAGERRPAHQPPPLARFVDGVSIAVERGTPLADVLRAQAVDVREAGKRQLLESAGRKEIGMMAPVVFFVLPITIVFALFPGAADLKVVAG